MIDPGTDSVVSALSPAFPNLRRAALRPIAALILVALHLGFGVAGAGAEPAPPPEFSVTTETSLILAVLQEQWLHWKGAFRRGDRDGGEEALSLLLEAIKALGMESSPEYARAASAMALRATREGRFEQARWALSAADRLDPLVSEVAFSRSALYRAEGAMMSSVKSLMEGYLRIWRDPFRRFVWLHDLMLWMLALVFLCGGLFILVQAVAKGGALYTGLVELASRRLPAAAAHALVTIALLWPAVLPLGLLWLLVYWSILLWSIATPSERVAITLVWVAMAGSPLFLEAQRQQLALSGSPAARAIEGLDRHRLHGSLLADLEVLSSTLPDDPAVDQLLGDVHRRFSQWEMARERYLRVLAAEPDNFGTLIDLGVYYFRFGDLEVATNYFQQAVEARPKEAVGHYDLSEALSASYLFERAERSLASAVDLDAAAVDRWIQREEGTRPVAVNGGLVRTREVRRQLNQAWKRTGMLQSWDELLGESRSLPFAVVLVAAAIALSLLRRRAGRHFVMRQKSPSTPALTRWRQLLVPGIASAEAGRGGRLMIALLAPAALISLPVIRQLGYPLPWALDPGGQSAGLAVAAGAALWFGLHIWRQLGREGRVR